LFFSAAGRTFLAAARQKYNEKRIKTEISGFVRLLALSHWLSSEKVGLFLQRQLKTTRL
jgi:hypothetical protein